jgi:hypothetical protein
MARKIDESCLWELNWHVSAPVLPVYCPDHPEADILHEWDRTVYHIRGGESGNPLDSNHHYYCSICRKELANIAGRQ